MGPRSCVRGGRVDLRAVGRHPQAVSPSWKGNEPPMLAATPFEDHLPRPSRVIAEALVQRHGPRRIVDRAARLGLSPQLTRAMVAACGATAVDPCAAPRRPAIPAAS